MCPKAVVTCCKAVEVVPNMDMKNSTQLPLAIDAEWHGDDPSRLLATQFAMHLEEIESRESDSELSRFLKDTCEKNTEDFEILTWWKVNSNKYPILSKLAKDVLAVPVSTVASESAFSTGGRVISSFRSSLSPKMAEVLICAQSWLRTSPKKLDMREIIKDLQNCEALEEGSQSDLSFMISFVWSASSWLNIHLIPEFADLNSGDLNSFSSIDTRSLPSDGWAIAWSCREYPLIGELLIFAELLRLFVLSVPEGILGKLGSYGSCGHGRAHSIFQNCLCSV
ncbi:hypothetical protein ACP70R_005773 [Stipagrostis hirtigluma subsp. patula]